MFLVKSLKPCRQIDRIAVERIGLPAASADAAGITGPVATPARMVNRSPSNVRFAARSMIPSAARTALEACCGSLTGRLKVAMMASPIN